MKIQTLVEDVSITNAKRFTAGLDTNRLQMILAVLNEHASLDAYDKIV